MDLSSMRRRTTFLFCVFALVGSSFVNAQHQSGRWTVGLHADGNMWFNDLNQRIVGLGGNVMARYGLARHVSLGIELGAERLKTGQEPISASKPFSYFRLNAVPISLTGFYHLLPGNPAAPYLFAGIGLFSYRAYVPSTSIVRKAISTRIPFGIGIETFIQKGVAYDFNVGYVVLHDGTETIRRALPDGYVNVRFGLNVYVGSADDEDNDGDGLTNTQEATLGTNPTNADTDEDGLSDKEETRLGTDPLNADTDFDKLKDGEEVQKYHTNPLKADTDSDGFSDGEEVFNASDPLDPKTTPLQQPN